MEEKWKKNIPHVSLDASLCISRGRRLRHKWRKIGLIQAYHDELGIANDEPREPIVVTPPISCRVNLHQVNQNCMWLRNMYRKACFHGRCEVQPVRMSKQLRSVVTPLSAETWRKLLGRSWCLFPWHLGTCCEVCCPLAALLNDVRHRSKEAAEWQR